MTHTAGLGRQDKLLDSAEFEAVFGHRKSLHGKYFSFHALGNTHGRPRLGLAVSRRVSKKAVQRNRIKRQVRESFRLQVGLASLDFVVVAKAGSAEQENQRLRMELDGLWHRASKKCENY